jgi:hypothetical protein
LFVPDTQERLALDRHYREEFAEAPVSRWSGAMQWVQACHSIGVGCAIFSASAISAILASERRR